MLPSSLPTKTRPPASWRGSEGLLNNLPGEHRSHFRSFGGAGRQSCMNRASLRLSIVLTLTACSSGSPTAATATSTSEPSAVATATTSISANGTPSESPLKSLVSASALEKVCKAKYVDDSSKIFIAFAEGKPTRLNVTPSRNIADMGNLVFDLDGNELGETTGGEFPWEDKALLEKEQARVAKLMAGASVPNDQKPLACPR